MRNSISTKLTKMKNTEIQEKESSDELQNFGQIDKLKSVFSKLYDKNIFEKFEHNKSIINYFSDLKNSEETKMIFSEIVSPFETFKKLDNLIQDNKLNDLKKTTMIIMIKNRFIDNYLKVLSAIENKKNISKTLVYFDFSNELKQYETLNSISDEISTGISILLKRDFNDELMKDIVLNSASKKIEETKEYKELKESEHRLE